MKRRFLAAVAAASIAVAWFPGGASAAEPLVPGLLDQRAQADANSAGFQIDTNDTLTQTFVAGYDALLTYVTLYCSSPFLVWDPVDFTVSMRGATATGSCQPTIQWVRFIFADPIKVTKGSTYTLTVRALGPAQVIPSRWDYGGGSAKLNGAAIPGVTDLAFQTFVQFLPSAQLLWDPWTVDPGVATPVTLTIVPQLPMLQDVLAVKAFWYDETVTVSYPSYFEPTSVRCYPASTVLYVVDCTDPLGPWTVRYIGVIPLFTEIWVDGTFTAPETAVSDLDARVRVCMIWDYLGTTRTDCADGAGTMSIAGVGPTPSPGGPATPPPTGTSASTPDSGSGLTLLAGALALLAACLGSFLVLHRVRVPSRRG